MLGSLHNYNDIIIHDKPQYIIRKYLLKIGSTSVLYTVVYISQIALILCQCS